MRVSRGVQETDWWLLEQNGTEPSLMLLSWRRGFNVWCRTISDKRLTLFSFWSLVRMHVVGNGKGARAPQRGRHGWRALSYRIFPSLRGGGAGVGGGAGRAQGQVPKIQNQRIGVL